MKYGAQHNGYRWSQPHLAYNLGDWSEFILSTKDNDHSLHRMTIDRSWPFWIFYKLALAWCVVGVMQGPVLPPFLYSLNIINARF